MANFKKNSNPTHRSVKTAKRAKQDRRWTLLFIGNHGKTITLKRFKGMVILAFAVLLSAIGISVGLFVWNLNIIMDNHGLKDELKSLNSRIDNLRHEKDILMTRLVVAESKAQQSLTDNAEASVPDKSVNQDSGLTEEKGQKTQAAPNNTEPPSIRLEESQHNTNAGDPGLSVAVEDFRVSDRFDENRLKVMFKVKNTSPNSQRVSGHAIVVLKGENTSWLPIPWMSLVDGRPTGKRRGHSFGINYFKTMRLSSRVPKSPEKFQTATIFIYTRQGQLLLEKEYPVHLPPHTPGENKPAASLHTLPVESSPAADPAETPAETPSATEILGVPSSDVPPGIPTGQDSE
jgi:hypothetical protein